MWRYCNCQWGKSNNPLETLLPTGSAFVDLPGPLPPLCCNTCWMSLHFKTRFPALPRYGLWMFTLVHYFSSSFIVGSTKPKRVACSDIASSNWLAGFHSAFDWKPGSNTRCFACTKTKHMLSGRTYYGVSQQRLHTSGNPTGSTFEVKPKQLDRPG